MNCPMLRPAGPTLDAELMRRLGANEPELRPFPYSTQIEQAMILVQAYGLAIIPQSADAGGYRWYVCKPRVIGYGGYGGYDMTIIERADMAVSADTLPHAVALCTLRLLGGDIWMVNHTPA